VVAPHAVAPESVPTKPKPEDKKEDKKESRLTTTATVVVKVPTGASLTVNGKEVTIKGTEQTFTTPALDPGQTYMYEFKAEAKGDGKAFTRSQRILIRSGQDVVVDLNETPADVGRVTVKLPADARLFVDGVSYPSTSATRSFETPRIEPGRRYSYELRAEVVRDGRTLSESRRVVVEAGKEVNVEFKDLPVVETASR
jgi:uncharacterized protein (TIGR03000 family)